MLRTVPGGLPLPYIPSIAISATDPNEKSLMSL
jgi:hypothetical protein